MTKRVFKQFLELTDHHIQANYVEHLHNSMDFEKLELFMAVEMVYLVIDVNITPG